MTAMRRFLGFAVLALLATVASPRVAQAACTSPAGEESQTRYDFTSHVMQYCDGTNWLSMGGGSSSGTAGYIQFSNGSGGFASDAGLFWDDTNKRLGIGTATPGTHIHEISSAVTNLTLQETGATNAAQIMLRNTARTWDIGSDSSPDGFYIHPEGGNQNFLFITPTGNVGIGTTSPATKLDVLSWNMQVGADWATGTARTDATMKGGYLTVPHYTNAQKPMAVIAGMSDVTSNSVHIGGYTSNYNAATDIRFHTAANSTTDTGTLRMLITSAGNVGIGTASPQNLLNISSAGGLQIGANTDAYWTSLSTNQLQFNRAGGVSYIRQQAIGGALRFTTSNVTANDTDAMHIAANGNVGIGTATPAAKLEVNGGIKVGNNAGGCSGTNNGELRYVSGASPPYSYCNGSAWVPFESGWVVPYTQFTAAQIVPGLYHTCALKSGGALWCWGYNNYGQVSDGTTTGRGAPTAAAGSFTGPWSSVSVGAYNTCGIKSADSSAWCWGYNSDGQLGDGTTINRTSSPIQISGTWDQIATGGSSTSVATYQSGYYTCGVKSDNTGWCWGANAKGTLGDGTTTDRTSPVQVSGNWKGIWMAPYESAHTCGIKTDDSLWCWGVNANGQLGDGTTTDRTSPVQVTGSWKKVVFAQRSTCALKTDNTLWCWGFNGYGALGDNTTTNRTSPVQVSGGGTWADVAIEAYSNSPTVFAIKSNGTAWSWGFNGYGDTKTGTSISTVTLTVPTALASSSAVSGTQWTDFEGGYLTMCGIRDDSTVYCWGAYNYYNRFGDPNLTTYFNPVGG